MLARGLADAGVPYAVKIHGSALEYTVKPHPRFRAVREGGAGERARDPRRLAPHGREPVGRDGRPHGAGADPARPAWRRRASASRHASPLPRARASSACAPGLAATDAPRGGRRVRPFARSTAEAAAALATIEPDDRLVVFVGKLIASKGVELLLAAWPLVLAREPRARLLVVGFGAFRQGLEGLARDLGRGDLDAARSLRAEHGGDLPYLTAFLDALDDAGAYRAAARGMTDRIAWAGRLDHPELIDVLPAAEAMAVPSTFPEAFGMVAAEAAACGALPVVAAHSGLAEVARTLGEAAPAEARDWLTFQVGPGAVRELAADLSAWLAAPGDLRAATRDAIVAATHEHLLVGRRRPHRDRGRPRRARRAAASARRRHSHPRESIGFRAS